MIKAKCSQNLGVRPRAGCLLALLMRLLWAALLALPAFGASAGVVFTSLYSFQVFPNGANPNAGLVQGSDGNFYGTTYSTTYYGGTNHYGTVFKISPGGALTTLHSFSGNDGANPDAGLVQGSDGNLYGTTYYGGTNDAGTVFRISTNGALTSLHSFNYTDGANPLAGLVQGGDGNLYGTTYDGGANNLGTVFKISTNGTLVSLHSFMGGSDGRYPLAGLVQGSDGNFYGTTYGGGTNDAGTVFRISANGALTNLHSFDYTDGTYPAGLVQGSDGNFYGTTYGGGTNGGYGTVFTISANGALISLHSFNDTDGADPGGLVQGSDGNFYGTTGGGGTNGAGTVFRISADGVLISLHSFNDTDGADPGGLVQGSDGNFYGTTHGGGTGNSGTVLRISTNGALTTLFSFTGGNDGAHPQAGLVQGSDGNFYGTTESGGTSGYGTAFEISSTGALTTLHSFSRNDGATPYAGLVQGSDGNFYGTTYAGGGTNGTVFKLSPTGTFTTLYSFSGNDGANPWAGLVQGSDGNLYGTTYYGGTNGAGTVFKISAAGALTSLYSFNYTDGAYPQAGLVQGSDGNFYGTTVNGGTNGRGTAFKINAAGALTSLYSFTGGNDGGYPAAGLVQANNGNFYGTTVNGGTSGRGTAFKINAAGALTTLYSFTGGNDGGFPKAGLVQASDGSFYGTTYAGGAGGPGTVFRLTIVPEFQAVTLTNSTLHLTWSTEAGGKYQLQFNSDLSSSNWTSLGSAVTAAGATLSATDSVTNGPRRFYRVALLP